MEKEYQVTLMCVNGMYKPVSCIIKNTAVDLTIPAVKKTLIQKGMTKICAARYWSGSDLKRYGYTKAKIREYDKEQIAAENAARYEAIKEQHYADGSWKRPKTK